MNSKEIIERLAYYQTKSGFYSERIVCEKKWTSLNYWKYRILRPVIKLKYKSFRKKNYPTPWLSPAAVLFFKEWLKNDMVGAEFGSGISTIFFAKRSKKVVSIEHYQPWYDKVVALFHSEGLENIEYKFIAPNKTDESFVKTLHTFEKYDFFKLENDIRWGYQSYFTALLSYEDDYFDYILVDGRARPECLVHAIDKLKSNGLMVLDNSERGRYESVFKLLESWPSFTTSNGLTNTTFWIKP